jgi:hypothetical protein
MLSRERCVGRRVAVDVGARVSLVRELLLIRSGVLSFSDLVFSGIDVDLMIDSLSRSVAYSLHASSLYCSMVNMFSCILAIIFCAFLARCNNKQINK